MTNTIYAIRDGQPRYDTVEKSQVAKRIKQLKQQGWEQIKVIA